jgi:tRNA (guanine37-N1)-methyltransferase
VKFTVVTLFPEMFESFLDASLLGKARAAGRIEVSFVDPRSFTTDKHRTVDDTPYGGGPGMVMKAPPVLEAIERAGAGHRILLTPTGAPLVQARVRELAEIEHIVLVCGRYEGIDERVSPAIDEELSLGDFVLTGGEPAAMALIDAVSRYVPGVLGEATSVDDESFSEPLLEYPQYTRPPDVRGEPVPAVLQSGNHAEIARWRRAQAVARTAARRPDLLQRRLAAMAERSYVCLAHHPVLDAEGETVTSSVTNLDIHDIARSASTFGLAGYYATTPITAQREMIERIIGNWQDGAERYTKRGVALAAVKTAPSIEAAIDDIARRHGGARPFVVATSARDRPGAVSMPSPVDESAPILLLFGTGHGLAEEVFAIANQVVTPIRGNAGFNHLSVRSAVGITLDRIFGKRAP